jgi:uncharacterized membrane protein YjgN (DUF898 family)
MWLKWLLLMFVTLGIYGFWIGPRIQKWKVENTDFAARPATTGGVAWPAS